jgi:cytochrome c oxidase assembly protein subunit 15
MDAVAELGGTARSHRADAPGRPLALARWLFAVAALIAAIVVVGGITRLTESGLSIVEWKPVTGVIPPLSDAQWAREFAAYQSIPQYTEVNGPAGMTLAQYQAIYFWEWLHRLLGRAIGLAMVLPLAWFWARRAIPAGYLPRLLALAALIGLQGAFGWLMVRSGLSGRTLVAPQWLAVHLLTALLALGGMVWTALDLRGHARGEPPARLTGFAALALAVLAGQLVYGALMAGTRAGYVASDWPAMQGALVPAGIDWSHGAAAWVDDPFLIHFVHRWWAFAVVAVLVVMGRKLRAVSARPASVAVHAAFGTQVLLGIATVMTGVALWLAVVHQLVGAALVAASAWGAHALGRRR